MSQHFEMDLPVPCRFAVKHWEGGDYMLCIVRIDTNEVVANLAFIKHNGYLGYYQIWGCGNIPDGVPVAKYEDGSLFYNSWPKDFDVEERTFANLLRQKVV